MAKRSSPLRHTIIFCIICYLGLLSLSQNLHNRICNQTNQRLRSLSLMGLRRHSSLLETYSELSGLTVQGLGGFGGVRARVGGVQVRGGGFWFRVSIDVQAVAQVPMQKRASVDASLSR